MPTPRVLLGDNARAPLKEGLDLMAALIQRTLGPRAGAVINAREFKGPEPLTTSATIVRGLTTGPLSGSRADNGSRAFILDTRIP